MMFEYKKAAKVELRWFVKMERKYNYMPLESALKKILVKCAYIFRAVYSLNGAIFFNF